LIGTDHHHHHSVVIPSLMLAGVNAWRLWSEHWEHVAHQGPLEERTEYPFMNIRTKNFCWGDGDKVMTYSPEKSWVALTGLSTYRLFSGTPR
jgi:hypothetical protein